MASSSSYDAAVQELYITYFGRPADPYGLHNFAAALAAANAPDSLTGLINAYSSNAAVKSLVDSFGTSKESATLYGPLDDSANATSFVTAVFQNLFDRAPVQAGLNFWVGAITSGQVTPASAALSIAAGALANTSPQGMLDTQSIANKLAAAGDFTTTLLDNSDVSLYSGAAAASIARQALAGVNSTTAASSFPVIAGQGVSTLETTYLSGYTVQNLTTGIDNLTGGPGKNIYNAIVDDANGVAAGWPANTLDGLDKITGAGLSNTLDIYDYRTGGQLGQPDILFMTGLTAMNITTQEGFVGDFNGWGNLKSLSITALAPMGTSYVVDVPAGASFTGSYQYGDVSITGGAAIHATAATYALGGNAYTFYINGDSTTTSVYLVGGQNADVLDMNVLNGSPNSIANVTIDHGVNASIGSSAVTALTIIGDTQNGVVQVSGEGAQRSDTITLNGDANTTVEDTLAGGIVIATGGAGSTGIALDIQSANSLTFNLGADLSLARQGIFYDLTDLNDAHVSITGTGALTADMTMSKAGGTIDASQSSGAMTLTLEPSQTFQGGSGQDIITISGIDPSSQGGLFAHITGGSAGDNELIIANDFELATLSLANVSNFQIFGITGLSQGTIDFAKYQGFIGFDLQDGAGANLFNVAPGSTLSLDGVDSAIVYQSSDGLGTSDTLKLALGTTQDAVVPSLTVEDSAGNGYGAIHVVSSGANQIENDIQQLIDSNVSQLSISGQAPLVIGNDTVTATSADIWNLQSASLAVTNTAGSNTSFIQALNGNNLQNLTFAGTAPLQIVSLTSTTHTLNIDSTDTGGMDIVNLADTFLASATITNATSATVSINVGISTAAAPLQSLSLVGDVTAYIHAGQVTGSVTISGATDNVHVGIVSENVTPSGASDLVVLGDGQDDVSFAGGAASSTQTVEFGNGWDGISSGSVGKIYITAGNGYDSIDTQGQGAILNIVLGTGENTVLAGTGASGSISFAAHQGPDAVTVGALGSAGAKSAVFLAITGLNNGGSDTLTFSDTAFAASGALTQISAANVTAAGGSITQLADWLATAAGKGGVVQQAAHGAVWFQFQGNTYLVETVAATDAGTLSAGDSVVELTGMGYTFSHASASAGVLTLHG